MTTVNELSLAFTLIYNIYVYYTHLFHVNCSLALYQVTKFHVQV